MKIIMHLALVGLLSGCTERLHPASNIEIAFEGVRFEVPSEFEPLAADHASVSRSLNELENASDRDGFHTALYADRGHSYAKPTRGIGVTVQHLPDALLKRIGCDYSVLSRHIEEDKLLEFVPELNNSNFAITVVRQNDQTLLMDIHHPSGSKINQTIQYVYFGYGKLVMMVFSNGAFSGYEGIMTLSTKVFGSLLISDDSVCEKQLTKVST